jgi:hypothetical protein
MTRSDWLGLRIAYVLHIEVRHRIRIIFSPTFAVKYLVQNMLIPGPKAPIPGTHISPEFFFSGDIYNMPTEQCLSNFYNK